ncbi:MAG TPA: hypothetical protein VIX59_11540 [Candidatus Binataceae bacterium]
MGVRNLTFAAFGPVIAALTIVLSAMPARAGNADAHPLASAAVKTSKKTASGGDPPFKQFHARGVGSSTFFGLEDCATAVGDLDLDCPDGDTCLCWTITVPLKSAVLGKSTLTMDLNFDRDQSVTNGTSGGLCLPGSGIGVMTFPGGATINVGFAGIECDSTVGSDDSFNGNGAFQFAGGTGKFTNAIGQTNTSIAASFSSTGPAAVAVDGSFSK